MVHQGIKFKALIKVSRSSLVYGRTRFESLTCYAGKLLEYIVDKSYLEYETNLRAIEWLTCDGLNRPLEDAVGRGG